MEVASQLADDARSLIQNALRDYDDQYGFGTMSCSAYDTAWVSLVAKTVDGQKQWLFPECFQFLLDTQSDEGGWTVGKAAQIDGILNTAGPLLALKRHAADSLQLQHDSQDIANRIEKATASLRSQLAAWDVSTTDHVGFEIIVPAMLDLLEKEDPSLVFDFEAKEPLMKIHVGKMSRFKPEYLYGPQRMTALHSLESFIGKIDFDRVIHHKVQGSMLGSPSSTAAYLMHASQWDDESEAYLRHVVKHAAGHGDGSVPSAFPSTHFESSWILSTLLRSGFTYSDMASPELTKMMEILDRSFEKEQGVLGFAPYFQADVDDTAKTITSLNKLGKPVSAEQMVKVFEADSHFRTYPGERDPSFTANANALLALLHQPDASLYSSQILKITMFLCDYWWKSDGKIKDKWNTCYLYPSVLLVEALVDVLYLIEQGKLPGVFDQESQYRVAISLFQVCFRPLLDQQSDGSWNQSIEETAYGILILGEARRIYFFEDLRQPLESAIERGVSYVKSVSTRALNYIWIEKVSYASPLLTESYLLAALKTASCPPGASVGSSVGVNASSARLDKHVKLFHQAELFSSLPFWELRGSMIEAALFLPLLRGRRLDIFPRKDVEDDEKYFDVIPFFWTSANNRARTYVSTSFLYDMTTISLLNFQLDEFMEAVAGPLFQGRMNELRQLVHDLLPEDGPITTNGANGNGTESTTTNGVKTNGADSVMMNGFKTNGTDPSYDEVFKHLSRFTKHVLEHPSVQSASPWDRKLLKREIRTYFLAHIQQADDSTRFENGQKSQRPGGSTTTTTFFNWVRTTSADHISAPYSFHFVACLLSSSLTPGGGGGDCFPSACEKFLAADVCRHASTMCRMYNDVGSAERDRDEGNLNSIDFPEFDVHGTVDHKAMALLRVGEYERSCVLKALEELRKQRGIMAREVGDAEAARLGERRMIILSMFCEQIDLYGQVYVVRDISSRMVINGDEGHKD